jgi:hypothetical protein
MPIPRVDYAAPGKMWFYGNMRFSRYERNNLFKG